MDFTSEDESFDGIVKMYEHKLKELNPGHTEITYDISHLYQYLDSLHDICALVLDPSTKSYAPKDKAWLKNSIFNHLGKQVRK
jgi:hypothetical protein